MWDLLLKLSEKNVFCQSVDRVYTDQRWYRQKRGNITSFSIHEDKKSICVNFHFSGELFIYFFIEFFFVFRGKKNQDFFFFFFYQFWNFLNKVWKESSLKMFFVQEKFLLGDFFFPSHFHTQKKKILICPSELSWNTKLTSEPCNRWYSLCQGKHRKPSGSRSRNTRESCQGELSDQEPGATHFSGSSHGYQRYDSLPGSFSSMWGSRKLSDKTHASCRRGSLLWPEAL